MMEQDLKGMKLSTLKDLPGPMKLLVGFAAGGSVIGTLLFALGNNKKALMIAVVGIAIVLTLLWLYKNILKWMKARKANPLSEGIAGNAAAAPQGISEPARRARLDDLRRNFDAGVEKFKAAGKNIYSVPWYVVVGEPGSGKTEAIRHCNVGFPAGLQDQLQGAGGTLNMNWWFTNQAIILDTAGRLMFEEVAPGSTNEWAEFLKLLKISRPNCPINGMLLVIPVDTLIKDTADSIEKKSTKIAQQFEQIQRTLGVRFPVFVIITKCDLLNGFREFFDDMNDPQLQHQMMGWSNPSGLDDKFDPSAVTNHLDVVKERLINRRRQLLLDPVNTEDPQARRVDQVDALYALPDSITKIGPRLKRYLETIFATGEWSPKPLFLRGIYFTSSMTEGSALDAELAEVMGVPVDSLPEGRVWRRDRAYFLRDLFIDKVFKERGLVTRANNADKLIRMRRMIILGCAFFALLLLFAITYFGSRQLENSIGKHRDFWTAAADNDPKYMEIINTKKGNAYNTDPFKFADGEHTVAAFFGPANLKMVQAPIQIPVIFKLMVLFGGNINSERANAYRSLFEATILRPIYKAARKKLPTLTADTWSDDATGAVQQLMKLEYATEMKKLPEMDHPQVELDPLFALVLPKDDLTKYRGDESGLQGTADWVYTSEAAGTSAWPASSLAATDGNSLDTITKGVDTTIAYWQREVTNKGNHLGGVFAMRKALRDFRSAEDFLMRLKSRPMDTLDQYNGFADSWTDGLNRLNDARDRATAAWTLISKDAGDSATFKDIYAAALDKTSTDATNAFQTMLKLVPPAAADPKDTSDAKPMSPLRPKIEAAADAMANLKKGPTAETTVAEIGSLDETYVGMIKGTDGNARHRFEVIAAAYAMADTFQVKHDHALKAPASLDDSLTQLTKQTGEAFANVDRLVNQGAGANDRLTQVGEMVTYAVNAGAKCQRYYFVEGALKGMPNDPDKWMDYVAALAATNTSQNLVRPTVPLVAFAEKTFPAKFAPDTVGTIVSTFSAMNRMANDVGTNKVLEGAAVSQDINAVKLNFDGYLAAYTKYWREDSFAELRFGAKNWQEYAGQLLNLRERTVRAALEDYGDKVTKALTKVNDTTDAAAVQAAVQLQTKRPFQEECSEVLSNWRDFGDNYGQVRRAILAMEPSHFLDSYTVGSAKIDDGFVSHYWQNISLNGIRLLANDSQADVLAGLQELGKYQRFPIAPAAAVIPGQKSPDLTPDEMLLARAALEKVLGSTLVAATSGPKSIGQGIATRDKDVDDMLDRLRGNNLLRDRMTYLTNLQKFFVAMPINNQPLAAKLTVLKDKLKDDNSVSQKYTYLLISESGKSLREAFLGGAVVDQCDMQYPTGDISLGFRDVPNGPLVQTDLFPGPWGLLRLMTSSAVKSITRDGTKWTIEYSVQDANQKVWSLWMQLDFKAELPDIKDWPNPGVH